MLYTTEDLQLARLDLLHADDADDQTFGLRPRICGLFEIIHHTRLP